MCIGYRNAGKRKDIMQRFLKDRAVYLKSRHFKAMESNSYINI